MRRQRRTKIVATLGPASSDKAMITRLFEATGADWAEPPRPAFPRRGRITSATVRRQPSDERPTEEATATKAPPIPGARVPIVSVVWPEAGVKDAAAKVHRTAARAIR